MIEPVRFRYNADTAASNVFQRQSEPAPEEAEALASRALSQHRALRDLLIGAGVCVTVCRSLEATPDATFCNNWFSTHPARPGMPATLVIYPLLGQARRLERRRDLVELLTPAYPRQLDLSAEESAGRYLESTGSLCLHQDSRTAFAALSPRTSRELAESWARQLDFRLVAFSATDGHGVPYYHTNVMMFVGHGVAGIALEAIEDPGERRLVEAAIAEAGLEMIAISRDQVARFCGNVLALASDTGEPLMVMSTSAWEGFSPRQRDRLARAGRLLHADLSAFEHLGGGSARCLIAELY